LSKVYFPRLVIPLTPLLAKLLDFAIAMVVLGGMMVWFQVQPTVWVLFVPLLVVMMMGAAFGTGMWLTALNVQYRDVRYAVGLLVQLWMYASPVVYPASLVPESLRLLYGLNPMAGVIEGFRAALLGTVAMPWDLIGVGAGTTVVLLVSGAYYFRRMEDVFADVV
jgi:lipopolysaccharide transport system permease protein